MTATRLHRRRAAALLLTVSAGSALGVAVVRTAPSVEHELTHRATRAVGLGGHRNVHVRYSGRDAVVRGVVRSDADRRRVVAIVRARRGTRTVDASGLLVHPGAPAPDPVGVGAPLR